MKIPFNANGLLGTAIEYQGLPITWRDNFTFSDTMRLHYISIRDASITLESVSSGQKYPVFLSEYEKIIRTVTMVKGEFSGTFTFRKRGRSYSITLEGWQSSV